MVNRVSNIPIENVDLKNDVVVAIQVINQAKEAVAKLVNEDANSLVQAIEKCYVNFGEEELKLKE